MHNDNISIWPLIKINNFIFWVVVHNPKWAKEAWYFHYRFSPAVGVSSEQDGGKTPGQSEDRFPAALGSSAHGGGWSALGPPGSAPPFWLALSCLNIWRGPDQRLYLPHHALLWPAFWAGRPPETHFPRSEQFIGSVWASGKKRVCVFGGTLTAAGGG